MFIGNPVEFGIMVVLLAGASMVSFVSAGTKDPKKKLLCQYVGGALLVIGVIAAYLVHHHH